jgi:serine/threonine protein kinase, bacterial
MSAEDGTPFGRYRLIEVLGRGGMGEVWRAHDTDTDRIVALKLLPETLSEDEDFQRRFRREAHAAARLNSPHVIPIHHYGEIEGRLYVDMRLVEGRDLHTLLVDGPLEPARAVHIIDQVAEALHAAHEVGLLHRDIKPSNILLDRNDFAYLIDFGIARILEETRITKSGNTIGTFQYIAPERLDSRTEDARADIYSLACVLYECLTGHPPFDGDTMARLVAAHLSAPPPRPSKDQPEVPPQVDEVIATGMAKDPDQRYATTLELADAARDAITVPIARPVANPTRVRATQLARQHATAQPPTVQAEPPAPTRKAAPRQPAPGVPTTAVGQHRSARRRVAIIGAVTAVVVAAVIGVIVVKRGSQSGWNGVSIPVGADPEGVAITPNGSTAYVTNSAGFTHGKGGDSVSVINTATNTVTTTIPVGTHPGNVAITPNGTTAYVTNSGSDNMSVIDTASNTVTATVPVGTKPGNVAITPNGTTAYVTSFEGGTVSVIDTATNKVKTTIPLGTNPSEVAIAPSGTTAYVTTNSNTVSVIDIATNTVTATIPVGSWPGGVAITPNGTTAYVANRGAAAAPAPSR